MAKPTRQDVLGFGLPPPAAASPPLLVERVDLVTSTLFYRAHGLSSGDALSLRVARDSTPGATAARLPPPLVEGTTYYALPTSGDAWQVAATSGGSAISLLGAAVGAVYWMTDPYAPLDVAIDRAWTLVQAQCIAHGGDVEAQIVTDATAALAVRLYVPAMAAGDPDKGASYDGLAALWPDTYKPLLDSYFAGAPVRGAADATPDLLENAAVLVPLAAAPFDGEEGRA